MHWNMQTSVTYRFSSSKDFGRSLFKENWDSQTHQLGIEHHPPPMCLDPFWGSEHQTPDEDTESHGLGCH